MTWIHQRGIQTLTHSESPQLYNHEVEARVNEKRRTFVTPHQQCYALSHTPFSLYYLAILKGPLVLPSAKYKDHDQIVSTVLGLGHGASLPGYVEAATMTTHPPRP